MTTMDNTGGIVGSTNLQVDPHGNLIILDPASGSQLGFLFNSDNGSLIMTDPNGDQTVILHAQPDRNPAVVRFNDNGVETMTSISADGATLTSEVIMVTGGTTTPIYTSESIFNADGSISRLRNDSDGTELTSYYDALTWDTTSDWNNLETGKSGTLVTESNGNQLGTWDNDDGTHGSVSYDATNQNLNMDWINADQSSVTLISDPQGITETDFDSSGNKTGDTYNLNDSSSTTDGTDDNYNGTATAMDDSAIIDNYSTDNPSAGDNWFSPDGNSDSDTYNNTDNAYSDS